MEKKLDKKEQRRKVRNTFEARFHNITQCSIRKHVTMTLLQLVSCSCLFPVLTSYCLRRRQITWYFFFLPQTTIPVEKRKKKNKKIKHQAPVERPESETFETRKDQRNNSKSKKHRHGTNERQDWESSKKWHRNVAKMETEKSPKSNSYNMYPMECTSLQLKKWSHGKTASRRMTFFLEIRIRYEAKKCGTINNSGI